MTPAPDSGSFEALVVTLGDGRLALPSAAVLEVARAVAATPLPGAPPIVVGTIGYRGALVPVFDLRERLGLPPKALALSDHLVIVRAGRRVAALRVDRAERLAAIDPRELTPATELARGTDRLAGAWRSPDGVVVVLEPERFLDEAEERSLAAALARSAPEGAA